MRQLLRRLTNRSKDFLFNPLFETFLLNRMRGSVACLLYHRIDDPSNDAFLARGGSPVTEPTEFTRDLVFLADRGARFVTFRDLLDGTFPARDEIGIAVCFDDCFLVNYTHGRDVLEKLGIRATFLQSTAMVDSDCLLWEHRLYWHSRDDAHAARFQAIAIDVLPKQGLEFLSSRALVEHLRENVPLEDCKRVLAAADSTMSSPAELRSVAQRLYPRAQHLRAAHRAGHEIGSHGHHHFKRANIGSEVFAAELKTSAAKLASILGEPPLAFSFPFDSYGPGDAAVVGQYFRIAATCDRRPVRSPADFMSMPRCSWPGPARNSLRRRRWLTTGSI